jgi:hypothetical protein
MSQILLAIDGPSPNVGSGATAPYGKATETLDGVETEGTGKSLGANGIAGGTMSDQTSVVVPSTRPVAAVDSSSPGINSGLPATVLSVTNATTETLPADQST